MKPHKELWETVNLHMFGRLPFCRSSRGKIFTEYDPFIGYYPRLKQRLES